jgi:RNA polymerase sigma-70 factor (ECF subfamily)
MSDTAARIDGVFRQESGRILATLIRFSGSFDLAEEALQEAFTAAVSGWREGGIPDNPAAWLTTVARRRLIDALRRQRTQTEKALEAVQAVEAAGSEEMPDDRLRLIFTCCHPALHLEAQVALTLRTLGGLTTAEIARSFLLPEATLAQRIVRAKRKIQEARIPYEVPPLERLAERLVSVQAVIYLIFNEGYAATSGAALIRGDLCAEAIRLSRVLCELMPKEPENRGLLALMLLQDSRRAARTGGNGELITLEDQDRTLWNREEIREGLALLPAHGGKYSLQARIAAMHASAARTEDTDWRAIAALYEELSWQIPSAVVALNHAAAIAMAEGCGAGLALMNRITELDGYYLFHSARADLLRRLKRNEEAAAAYRRAIALATNPVEREYLARRLHSVGRDTP